MRGDNKLYKILDELNIQFEYYEHPPVPTIEKAKKYWKDISAGHCKNIFFRNHKGNKHYLVSFDYTEKLVISDLETRLKQGKLSFASDKRLEKYLGLKAGSVSPFGLINDLENHIHVFLDINLQKYSKISFHPNINTASLVIDFNDFIKFLDYTGNKYEFLNLY